MAGNTNSKEIKEEVIISQSGNWRPKKWNIIFYSWKYSGNNFYGIGICLSVDASLQNMQEDDIEKYGQTN